MNSVQTVNDGVAHSKNPTKCTYHVNFDLDLEHTLDAGLPETTVCKFGRDPAICLREGAKVYRRTDRQTNASPLYKLILGMS